MAFVQTRTIYEERLDLVELDQELLRMEDCHEDGNEYNPRTPDKVRVSARSIRRGQTAQCPYKYSLACSDATNKTLVVRSVSRDSPSK